MNGVNAVIKGTYCCHTTLARGPYRKHSSIQKMALKTLVFSSWTVQYPECEKTCLESSWSVMFVIIASNNRDRLPLIEYGPEIISVSLDRLVS